MSESKRYNLRKRKSPTEISTSKDEINKGNVNISKKAKIWTTMKSEIKKFEVDWNKLNNIDQLDKTAADILVILKNDSVKSSIEKKDDILQRIKKYCTPKLFKLVSEKIKNVEKVRVIVQGKYGPSYIAYALWYTWDDHRIAYYYLDPYYGGDSLFGFIWEEKHDVMCCGELTEYIKKWGLCSLDKRDKKKYSLLWDLVNYDEKLKLSDLNGIEFLTPLLIICNDDERNLF